MKKAVFLLAVLVTMVFFTAGSSADEPDALQVIPLAAYNHLALDEFSVYSTTLGTVLMKGSDEVSNPEDIDSFFAAGLYTFHYLSNTPRFGYPRYYHSIDAMVNGQKGRHQYLLIVKSESDEPVTGGLSTFQTGAVYGYRVVHTSSFSLVLGGGLAAADFGIELEDGTSVPVLPVPLIRSTLDTQWLEASFDFITSPSLEIVLGPELPVRVTADMRIDQFRDYRDFIYDFALWYRPFPPEGELGDIGGLSVGIKNENLSCDTKDGSMEIHYNSVYAKADITLLSVEGGYVLSSREMYDETSTFNPGKGFFVTVQGMYQF